MQESNIAWTDSTWNPTHGCSKVSAGCETHRKINITAGCSDVMPKGQPMDDNPNWGGGRTETEHGYILIKRPDHPGSDSRGYIYEHRLVAEEMLGRSLSEDEQVHHKNGERDDNRPENLEVVTIAEHRARHREDDTLRDPGEPNPTIGCACGCGERLRKYDSEGRKRQYISGHNSKEQPSPLQDAVLRALSDGPLHREDIAAEIGRTVDQTATVLSKLRNKGLVKPVKRGVWGRADE